jgi:beta-xylosidase
VVEPVPLECRREDRPQRDDFEAPELGPEWISVRTRPGDALSLTEQPGSLVLHARDGSIDSAEPAFAGRRQQHTRFTARAAIDAAHGRGGLVVRIDESHYYAIEAGSGEVRCRARSVSAHRSRDPSCGLLLLALAALVLLAAVARPSPAQHQTDRVLRACTYGAPERARRWFL